MADENPTLEGSTEGTDTGTDTGVVADEGAGQETIDVDGLVAQLEAAGVSNTEQLEGKLTASKEAGQLANLLGQSNQRVRELEGALQQRQTQPQPQEDIYEGGGEVDIQGMLRQTIREEVARERQMTMQAQQYVNERWREITNDPDYPQVKEIWEQKCQNPDFNHAIQSGQADPVREYNTVVRDYFRGIAKKAADAITVLNKGGKASIPHVEGAAAIPDATPDLSGKEEKMKTIRDRVAKSGKLMNEEDQLAALDTMLGPG